MGHYDILEHTADIGLRARADSLEELFAIATEGMHAIAGTLHPAPEGEEIALEVEADDLAGLLVEWLGEALYVQDSRSASVAGIHLDEVSERRARGVVRVRAFAGGHSDGVQIKAVTFHQLAVERSGDQWVATVFFDI
ncbi:MAG: archease [Actinomycetota bacterium]|nr:archease [Actinomycetota bacterium]